MASCYGPWHPHLKVYLTSVHAHLDDQDTTAILAGCGYREGVALVGLHAPGWGELAA